MTADGMHRSAQISDCGRYRYGLRRSWNSDLPPMVFVGLNPSTADGTQDDPTIRRCIRFARDWGFGGLTMLNMYALRATNPGELLEVVDPTGPQNYIYLKSAGAARVRGGIVVCCWGSHRAAFKRQTAVTLAALDGPVYHLGLTQSGAPRHPLYLRADTQPTEWTDHE